MTRRTRLGLVAGAVIVVAVFAYLCVPGHPLGTFFYNVAPSRFRSTVGYAHHNSTTFWTEVKNHLVATGLAVGIASVICIPLGIAGSRLRFVRLLTTNIVGIARGVPGIAVMFLAVPLVGGVGIRPALIALTILAAPPIFLNTAAGYAGVDAAVVEAGRGMGMSRLQVLLRIETPLALPVVIAGLRTATVEVIASATIATYIVFDTLGGQIANAVEFGQTTFGQDALVLGVTSIAAIALLAELMLAMLQRLVTPAPLRLAPST